MTGNVFGEFEYCNRKKETSVVLREPPLNCSREEEFAYVTNNLMRAVMNEGISANMEALKYEVHRKCVSNL